MNIAEQQAGTAHSTFRRLVHGELSDLSDSAHPTIVTGWSDSRLDLQAEGTHFGFVRSGRASLESESGKFNVTEGMYFAVPGACHVEGSGEGMVVTRLGYGGFFHIGGPIEEEGRLRYIDGCTDSLLVPPVLKGDACLNLLHVPPGTDQTAHTHPSVRVGLIVEGEGHCETPRGNQPLLPGTVFVLPAGELHSFHTRESSLTIIAYHPDSDFGPTHEEHPMLNRTIIHGSKEARR